MNREVADKLESQQSDPFMTGFTRLLETVWIHHLLVRPGKVFKGNSTS